MGSCFEDLVVRNKDVKADLNLDNRVKSYAFFLNCRIHSHVTDVVCLVYI